MTRRVISVLEDDVDGGAAQETVRFGLDGTMYEIDLSNAHAEQLRTGLAVWVEHARRGRGGPQKPHRVVTGVDPRAVRAWAASQGIQLSNRGRVPAEVVAAFRAAGN